MFKKILVPSDGSDVAERVIPVVAQLALRSKAELVLHTVVNKKDSAKPVASSISSTGGKDSADAHQDSLSSMHERIPLLDSAETIFRKRGLATDIHVTSGSVAPEIIRAAESTDCDLIAMSTHGRNFVSRAILGSVTDKVVRSSQIPVLLVTPEEAGGYLREDAFLEHVTVLLDGSSLASKAIPYAQHLAESLSLELVLVQVARSPDIGIAPGEGDFGFAWGETRDLSTQRELLIQNAREYLAPIAQRLQINGLRVRTEVLEGHPVATLIEFTRHLPSGIIAMTTHGRSGATRWFLGSVTDSLIRSSGHPVMVIPNKND